MSSTTKPCVTAQMLRERFGISAGHASELANLKRPPSLKLAIQLHEEAGVSILHWKPAVAAAEARAASKAA